MTVSVRQNGGCDSGVVLNRAEEVDDLLSAVRGLILPFIKAADDAASQRASGALSTPNGSSGPKRNVLVDTQRPSDLVAKLKFDLPGQGKGKDGLLEGIEKVLDFSVNTWDQGFLDKLYASNNAVGIMSDIVLSVLNTNLHVYQVSPALTVVEKTTGRALAKLFGFDGPMAGGFTCQGGSSSNLTSMVVARNTLYPDCKKAGNQGHNFVAFTSAHGHYSVEKSAMVLGLGSDSIYKVAVDSHGCMKPSALREKVLTAKAEGKTPFYVNATAGTTVMGSFEPFEDIANICKEFGLWMHIDASWGGPVIFSSSQSWKLKGSHLADSITINPHKMMNVPTTCSFLLGPDMRIFNKANSTTAGYLFHRSDDDDIWDLADLTLQCGRRGDALKLALAWLYYGKDGFERQIDHAFEMAAYLHDLVQRSGNFEMVSEGLPPCLQVCFYHSPGGSVSGDADTNTARTRDMVYKLIERGFMIDFAPGEKGSFFRVVVNLQTQPSTVEGLVRAIEEVGKDIA